MDKKSFKEALELTQELTKLIRKEGYNQNSFAKKTGLMQVTIFGWEHGRVPTLQNLIYALRVLGYKLKIVKAKKNE